MITKKMIRSIDELQEIQRQATRASEDVAIASLDGSINVDAKSFIGLFALDFSEPVLLVSEDEKFHKRVEHIGVTVE